MPYVIICMLCMFSNYVFNFFREYIALLYGIITQWGFCSFCCQRKSIILSNLSDCLDFQSSTCSMLEQIYSSSSFLTLVHLFSLCSVCYSNMIYLRQVVLHLLKNNNFPINIIFKQERGRIQGFIDSKMCPAKSVYLALQPCGSCVLVQKGQKNKRGEGLTGTWLLHRLGQLTNLPQRYFECLPFSS